MPFAVAASDRVFLTFPELLSAGRAEPHASCFYIQLHVHNHWSFMVQQFENLVLTGRTPIPAERTLLATGITLFGLESRQRGQVWLETPELEIRYGA